MPVANLFSELGYFTRFHINIYPTETTMQLSDIDVYAIKFDSSLLEQINIIEVKEESNKFSDLFKLYGFTSYYGNCRSLFIAKKIHPRIIPIAKQLDINLMSFKKLKEIVSKETMIETETLTLEDGIKFFENLYKVKQIDYELFWNYHYLWLEKDPFKRFYYQQKLFKKTVELLDSIEEKNPIYWLRRELFILSIISLVEITSYCMTIEDGILNMYLENKFLNVDIPADSKIKIKEGIDVLINTIKKIDPSIDTPAIEITPTYISDIEKIIKLFIKFSNEVQWYININEIIYKLILKEKAKNLAEITNKKEYKFVHEINDIILRILHSGPIKEDFKWFI